MSTTYIEFAPNLETISNQSHSFFFPPMIAVDKCLDIKYNYEGLKELFDIKEPKVDDITSLYYKKSEDIHALLDYTMLSDEWITNIIMLFGELPTEETNDNNLIKFMRTEGIEPFELESERGDNIAL